VRMYEFLHDLASSMMAAEPMPEDNESSEHYLKRKTESRENCIKFITELETLTLQERKFLLICVNMTSDTVDVILQGEDELLQLPEEELSQIEESAIDKLFEGICFYCLDNGLEDPSSYPDEVNDVAEFVRRLFQKLLMKGLADKVREERDENVDDQNDVL
jgi:hypothetical protein